MSLIDSLIKTNNTKIVMLVLDGLGGLPDHPHGQTELERATTPHLDKIAKEAMRIMFKNLDSNSTVNAEMTNLKTELKLRESTQLINNN